MVAGTVTTWSPSAPIVLPQASLWHLVALPEVPSLYTLVTVVTGGGKLASCAVCESHVCVMHPGAVGGVCAVRMRACVWLGRLHDLAVGWIVCACVCSACAVLLCVKWMCVRAVRTSVCGMAWHGVAWHGMAWRGVVWRGAT